LHTAYSDDAQSIEEKIYKESAAKGYII